MNIDHKQASDLLLSAKKIAIIAHRNPDGDSLGGALALASGLKQLERDVVVLCESDIDNSLKFLPDSDGVKKSFESGPDLEIVLKNAGNNMSDLKYKVDGDDLVIVVSPERGKFDASILSTGAKSIGVDLVVTIDCGDMRQLGTIYETYKEQLENVDILNIDHHISNDGYGTHNLIDVDATSSCEVLLELLDKMAKEKMIITDDVATCLLAGIIADTGSFMNTNTESTSLKNASRLMSLGADHVKIIKSLYKTNPLGRLKLWGELFGRIQTIEDVKLLYVWIEDDDYIKYNLPYGEDGKIIDKFLTSVPGYDAVVVFSELGQKKRLEVSARSPNSTINLFKFMEKYDGGGHKVAAGCKIPTDNIRSKRDELLKELVEYMKSPESKIVKEEEKLMAVEAAKEVAEEVSGEVSKEVLEEVVEKAPEVISKERGDEPSELDTLKNNANLKDLPEDHPLRKLDKMT